MKKAYLPRKKMAQLLSKVTSNINKKFEKFKEIIPV